MAPAQLIVFFDLSRKEAMKMDKFLKRNGEAGRIRTREEKIAMAQKFSLMSDVFMSVALDDVDACQYVVRILTGIKDLEVKEVRSQYRISKITAHDAILDILAEDSQGQLYNLEIQRKDTVDHARRTRFYGSMIDSEYLKKGLSYDSMPDVYVIYISEKDIWKAGHTSYTVKKYFEHADLPYNDGMHVIYINAAVDDGSEIAGLMEYFKTSDPSDMSQGALSERVHFLKCEEGGQSIMCEVSDRIYQEGKAEGIQLGKAEGIQLGKVEGIQEGKKEGKKEAAIGFAAIGIDEAKIAKALEVTVEQVRAWLQKG